jgi:hypothetical protein
MLPLGFQAILGGHFLIVHRPAAFEARDIFSAVCKKFRQPQRRLSLVALFKTRVSFSLRLLLSRGDNERILYYLSLCWQSSVCFYSLVR